MNVIRSILILALAASSAAACAESQPYPVDYRLAETDGGRRQVWIIGADMADVCDAIADRTCSGDDVRPGCRARVLERCIPAGGARLEYANDEAYHRDWWACLGAITSSPRPRWGTTRPRACVPLTPFWKAIPVTVTRELAQAAATSRPPAAPAPDTYSPPVNPNPPAPGLPLDAVCVPTRDDCAAGLTCRMLAAHDGRCRPVGTWPAGAICTSTSECGAAMICAQAADGRNRCETICDVYDPSRCTGGLVCRPYVGDDVGVCVP